MDLDDEDIVVVEVDTLIDGYYTIPDNLLEYLLIAVQTMSGIVYSKQY